MYFLIETGPAGRLIAALGTGAAGRLIAGAASRSIPKTKTLGWGTAGLVILHGEKDL